MVVPTVIMQKKKKGKEDEKDGIDNFFAKLEGKNFKIVKTFITAFFVLRLIRIVKQGSSWFKMHTIKCPQFNIINDMATHYNYYYYSNFMFEDIPSVFAMLKNKLKK